MVYPQAAAQPFTPPPGEMGSILLPSQEWAGQDITCFSSRIFQAGVHLQAAGCTVHFINAMLYTQNESDSHKANESSIHLFTFSMDFCTRPQCIRTNENINIHVM